MKTDSILFRIALFTLLGSTSAFPGWAKQLEEIKRRDTGGAVDSAQDSTELLGDLVSPGPQTDVGKAVADILSGKGEGQGEDGGYRAPGPLGSDACKQDSCCVYKYAADEMKAAFRGPSGRCNALARRAVRLGFHDAGTWKKGLTSGGADGSMILTDEVSRPINAGLEEVIDTMRQWYNKYSPYGAGAADLIQLGATTATVVCPLGPRIRTFIGRQDNAKLPPDGLLPDVNAPADQLIQLFMDKTIMPNGLTALVGAHTTSQQRFFDPKRALDPQDLSPGVWDVLFYPQTLNPRAPKRVLKFPADVKFSTHPRMAEEWKEFADPKTGQEHWNSDFAREYVRLSMLGVNNINNMSECTKVLPPRSGGFNPPDLNQVNQWLQGGFNNYGSAFGSLLDQGQSAENATLSQNGINPADATNKAPPPPGSPFSKPPPAPARPSVPVPTAKPSPTRMPKRGGGQDPGFLQPSQASSVLQSGQPSLLSSSALGAPSQSGQPPLPSSSILASQSGQPLTQPIEPNPTQPESMVEDEGAEEGDNRVGSSRYLWKTEIL
ncbi:heme peroxidase [Microthyrium microscopicum]|uniref:Peroxidase n=1 Tax=Microthyrium microscopicum TaxID=703497 RepID=A0A6A6UNT9_9PEZI|nr:heme peroxidase [Microthyrium microscopicum]